jgi:hypothetical protein
MWTDRRGPYSCSYAPRSALEHPLLSFWRLIISILSTYPMRKPAIFWNSMRPEWVLWWLCEFEISLTRALLLQEMEKERRWECLSPFSHFFKSPHPGTSAWYTRILPAKILVFEIVEWPNNPRCVIVGSGAYIAAHNWKLLQHMAITLVWYCRSSIWPDRIDEVFVNLLRSPKEKRIIVDNGTSEANSISGDWKYNLNRWVVERHT